MRLLIILFTIVLKALAGSEASEAATMLPVARLSPELFFETFRRDTPESLQVVRLGGGLVLSRDLWWRLGAQLGAAYASEEDTFSSGNTFDENAYRGRIGLYANLHQSAAFRVTALTGAQYTILSHTYITSSEAAPVESSDVYWAPYFGAEVEVIPVSGFGIREGISTYFDKFTGKWVARFSIGLTF